MHLLCLRIPLIEMRPLKINGEELRGACPMVKYSLVPAVQELWNTWEIHCLILLSLFLQAFLFLSAGMRRRSSSRPLRTVLWLAYLSADSVAIFVLGHLAARAGEPRHQLMSLWAPFVLVHLGGQDTITALSKQDNELWLRHLLTLVSQVAVAGYVVAKSSWADRDTRLRAAMVLMFLSGCFKYAERTACLYLSSPGKLRSNLMNSLPEMLLQLEGRQPYYGRNRPHIVFDDMMLKGKGISSVDIISVDAPLNEAKIISVLDYLPNKFMEFLSSEDRYGLYKLVEAHLLGWYKTLYTKNLHGKAFYEMCRAVFSSEFLFACAMVPIPFLFIICPLITLVLLYTLFRYVSTPIALVLFAAAEKGDRLHTSRVDITVSYVLFVGAIVLDVSSIFFFMTSNLPDGSVMTKSAVLRIANYIQPAWSRKQWSQELAQYSMIKKHAVKDTAGMAASIRQWISKLLGYWGIEFFYVTHTPISKHDAPIKEFILDNLLRSGTRREWNVASSRGQLAVQKWMRSHQQDPDSLRTGKALEEIITSGVDFPTTVIIWHIATDICYYFGDNPGNDSLEMKKYKQMSRQLSTYIMYLVFKCGVMLTTNSKLLHDRAHDEISKILSAQQISLGEKAAVMKLYDASKKEEEQQGQSTIDIEKLEEPADDNNNAADSHLRKVLQSAEAVTSPVMPSACMVAKELISINDETERWGLIAEVWSEMLYYTAPRCGCAFHYEHLTTGGEFITHVLLLMKFLGPFLPAPAA